jgi:hypothetical protein
MSGRELGQEGSSPPGSTSAARCLGYSGATNASLRKYFRFLPGGTVPSWSRFNARTIRSLAGRYGDRVTPRPRVLIEVVFLTVWFVLFARLHAAAGTSLAAAEANALTLQSLERATHIDIELAANRWLTARPVLGQAAVWVYRLYYLVVAGTLVWVFLRHADAYRRVRRTMVAMMVLVLPVYWAIPMSPPRFALPGAVDLVARYDIVGRAAHESWIRPTHHTAMPSMHVGWSLWCAYAVWSVLRVTHPRAALLAWVFPLLMIAIVFGTANHYVLDVVGSLTLLAAAIAAASLWGRLVRRRPVSAA